MGSPLAQYARRSSYGISRNQTRLTLATTRGASPACRPAIATALITRCIRPDNARSMDIACSSSRGFPNTRSSSTTTVSAASTGAMRASPSAAIPARAFSHAIRSTNRRGGSPALRISSIGASMIV